MADILFFYEPFSDSGAFGAYGSWSTGLPLANLQSRALYNVARSTNANLTSTKFRIDLGLAKQQKAIMLGPHNGSLAMKYRISCYSDSGYSSLVSDTGWIDRAAPSLSLEWEDPDFWFGLSTAADDPEVDPWIIHVYDSPPTARYWQFEIDDAANSDGYWQAGRLFMAGWWAPTVNYSYDANSLAFQDRTIVEEAMSGVEYFWRRRQPRIFGFGVNMVSEDEMFSSAYRLLRIAGTDGEIFVIPDSSASFLQRRSFIGRVSKGGPMQQVMFGFGNTSFEIKELL